MARARDKCKKYDAMFLEADFDQLDRMGYPIWDTGEMSETERDAYYDEVIAEAEKEWKKKPCSEKRSLLIKAGILER